MKWVSDANKLRGQEVSFETWSMIQEGALDNVVSIVRGLGVDSNVVTVLWGVQLTDNNPDYVVSAGAVYYNDEVYLVSAYAGNDAVDVPALKVQINDLHGPQLFADQTSHSIYFDNVMEVVLAPAGTELVDVVNVERLEDKLTEKLGIDNKISTAINGLLDGAPAALDTLNEIAEALNDDADAFNTLSNLIATKADQLALDTETSRVDNIVALNGEKLASDNGTHNGLMTRRYDTVQVIPLGGKSISLGSVSHTSLNLYNGNNRQIRFTCSFSVMREGASDDLVIIGVEYSYDGVLWNQSKRKEILTDSIMKEYVIFDYVTLTSTPVAPVQFRLSVAPQGSPAEPIQMCNDDEIDIMFF